MMGDEDVAASLPDLKGGEDVKGSVLQSAEGSVLGQHDAVSVHQHSGSLYAKFINRSCSQEAFSLSLQLATAGSDLLGAEARGTARAGRSGCAPRRDRQPPRPFLSGNSSLEFESDSRTTAILESSEPGRTTTRFGLRRCWKFEFHGDFAFYICSSGLVTSSCGTGRQLGTLLLLGRGAQAQNGQLTLNCNSDAVARFSAMAKLVVSGGESQRGRRRAQAQA